MQRSDKALDLLASTRLAACLWRPGNTLQGTQQRYVLHSQNGEGWTAEDGNVAVEVAAMLQKDSDCSCHCGSCHMKDIRRAFAANRRFDHTGFLIHQLG